MEETLLTLLTAHFIADFPLQPAWMLTRKKRPYAMGLHILIVGFAAAVITGSVSLTLLMILIITHLLMDLIKVCFLKDTLPSFFIDQVFHLCVIAGLSLLYPAAVAEGWWGRLPAHWMDVYFTVLCVISGIILSIHVGAIIIRKATARFTQQLGEISNEGLDRGGLYIGSLERGIVMLLMLINQPSGVGFLVTAKSILRFSDLNERHHRALTEYVIIGTLMSFGWALLIGVITQIGIHHWLPLISANSGP